MPRAVHSWMAPSLHSNICRPWFRKHDALVQSDEFFSVGGWVALAVPHSLLMECRADAKMPCRLHEPTSQSCRQGVSRS